MTITLTADGSAQLKLKNDLTTIGNGVTINSFRLPGPGEYDVASVQTEVYPVGSTGLAYLIRSDDLLTIYLDAPEADVTKIDNASNCNILIIDVRSNGTPEVVKQLVKTLEPSYVVLIGSGADEAVTALGLTTQQGPLKVTRSSLPLEGTTVITA